IVVFFFSSRRRHTRSKRDWSSDVCSSDLTAKLNRRVIKARMNEGYTIEDFKTVIDKKTAKWIKDKKMEEFLRPETLFGNKFDRYLNESNVAQNKSREVAEF